MNAAEKSREAESATDYSKLYWCFFTLKLRLVIMKGKQKTTHAVRMLSYFIYASKYRYKNIGLINMLLNKNCSGYRNCFANTCMYLHFINAYIGRRYTLVFDKFTNHTNILIKH